MIKVKFDSRQFTRDMKNMMNYSIGFLEGIEVGKIKFLNNLGLKATEMLKEFIDSNARMNPEMLHHVYEWNRTGSPEARLFETNYTVSSIGISFKSNFKQSESVKPGSREPFYNKALVMENAIPVIIRPKNVNFLKFEVNGEEVFTNTEVTVYNPGGDKVEGGFHKVFDLFFTKYFTQAFMRQSGISEYINNPIVYKKNLSAGKRMGKSKGVDTGYRWIANAGVSK